MCARFQKSVGDSARQRRKKTNAGSRHIDGLQCAFRFQLENPTAIVCCELVACNDVPSHLGSTAPHPTFRFFLHPNKSQSLPTNAAILYPLHQLHFDSLVYKKIAGNNNHRLNIGNKTYVEKTAVFVTAVLLLLATDVGGAAAADADAIGNSNSNKDEKKEKGEKRLSSSSICEAIMAKGGVFGMKVEYLSEYDGKLADIVVEEFQSLASNANNSTFCHDGRFLGEGVCSPLNAKKEIEKQQEHSSGIGGDTNSVRTMRKEKRDFFKRTTGGVVEDDSALTENPLMSRDNKPRLLQILSKEVRDVLLLSPTIANPLDSLSTPIHA